MTCYLSYLLMLHYELKLTAQITVPPFCTWALGTSASLLPNDTLTLNDLFHGLMLPSGNDAALALAWFFGDKLVKQELSHYKTKSAEIKSFTGWNKVKRFVQEMNKTAGKLLLKNTQFTNANGLGDKSNRSTAEDITKLSLHALQIAYIKTVISTKIYTTTITNTDVPRTQTWLNTNQLLSTEGFIGMKTGITPTAGPCLTVVYNKDGVEIILTLLNSKNIEHRWEEARRLVAWAKEKLAGFPEKVKVQKNWNIGKFRNRAYFQSQAK